MEVRIKDRVDLTANTVPGRDNFRPNLIRDSNQRLVALYSKKHVTGVLETKRLSYTQGTHDVVVPAGQSNSDLNSFSWDETIISVNPSSYAIIVADETNGIHAIYADTSTGGLPVDAMSGKVLIGFINSGASTIVYAEVAEPNGNYIYAQKQKLKDGAAEPYLTSDWEWEGFEYRLNSGSNPKGVYLDGVIYIAYERDGGVWTRELDESNPLTYEYVPNYTISNGTINLDSDIHKNTHLSVGGSKALVKHIYHQLFYVSSSKGRTKYIDDEDAILFALGLDKPDLGVEVVPPYHYGDYKQYVYSPVVMHVFNSNNVDVAQIEIGTENPVLPVWSSFMSHLPEGTYYFGLSIYKHGLDNTPYTTPEDERVAFELIKSEYVIDGNNVSVQHPQVGMGSNSSSSLSINKTLQYTQDFVPVPDDSTETTSQGCTSTYVNNTFSFNQNFNDAIDDDQPSISVASSAMAITLTSEV